MAAITSSFISRLLRSNERNTSAPIFGQTEDVIRQILEPLVQEGFHKTADVTRIINHEMYDILGQNYGCLAEELELFVNAANRVARDHLTQEERFLLDALSKRAGVKKPKQDSEKRTLIINSLVVIAKVSSFMDQLKYTPAAEAAAAAAAEAAEESEHPAAVPLTYNASHPCSFHFLGFLLRHIMFVDVARNKNFTKTNNQHSFLLRAYEIEANHGEESEQAAVLCTVVQKLVGEGKADSIVSVALAKVKAFASSSAASDPPLDKSMHDLAKKNWALEDCAWEVEERRLATMEPQAKALEKQRLQCAIITKFTGGEATKIKSGAKEEPSNTSPDVPSPLTSDTAADVPLSLPAEAPDAPLAETEDHDRTKRKASDSLAESDSEECQQPVKKRRKATSIEEPREFQTAQESEMIVEEDQFVTSRGDAPSPVGTITSTSISSNAQASDAPGACNGSLKEDDVGDEEDQFSTARGTESAAPIIVGTFNGVSTDANTSTTPGAVTAALAASVPILSSVIKIFMEANENNVCVPPAQLSIIKASISGLEKQCRTAGVTVGPTDDMEKTTIRTSNDMEKTVRTSNANSKIAAAAPSSATVTAADLSQVPFAVDSIMGDLNQFLREMGQEDFKTKENHGYGSADGGLSISNQGLMYSFARILKSGSCDSGLESYLKDYLPLVFESFPEPATDIERALGGCKYGESDFYFIKTLGGGSFGTVLLVRHKKDPKMRAALKVASFNAEEFLKYGRRELVQGSQIKSPHVIRLLGFFPMPSVSPEMKPITVGMLLEECEHTLKPVIKQLNKQGNDKMAEEEFKKKVLQVCQILLQLLTGVRDIHAGGITHRDIKPGNVGLGKDGLWKLFDMGLARSLTAVADMTVNAGSPHYMPPGGRGENHDEFSLAVMFYVMMTGKFPTRKKSNKSLNQTEKTAVSKAFGFGVHSLGDAGKALVELYANMIEPKDSDRMTADDALPMLDGIIGSLKSESK